MKKNIPSSILWFVWIIYAIHYSVAYHNWYEDGAVWMFLGIVAVPLIISKVYKTIRYFIYSNHFTKGWCVGFKRMLHNNINIEPLFRWILLLDILFASLMTTTLYIYIDNETAIAIIKPLAYITLVFLPCSNTLPYLLEYWFYRRGKLQFLIGVFAALLPLSHFFDLPFAGKYVLYLFHISAYALICLVCFNLAKFIRCEWKQRFMSTIKK